MDKFLDELQDRELDLDQSLRRILRTAVEWVDARYGALGVIGEDRLLSQFITVGMDEEQKAAIGRSPQGRGLLGELISHPVPLRLAELSKHPSSCGFPENHPPMHSFLGVPIRVRGEVFGNLYLTEKWGGEFDARDEWLLWTLAVAAGHAVDSVRWYREAWKRERGLLATAKVTGALLAGADHGEVLRLVVNQAMEVGDADLGLVALPTDDRGALSVKVAVGAGAAQYQDIDLPVDGSFVGVALRSQEPISSSDIARDARVTAGPRGAGRLGPAMAVQLANPLEGGTRGILMLGRLSGRVEFTTDDFDPLSAFARQADLAFLAQRRQEAEQMRLINDRDRIARDLHDMAIQRMIGTAMSLQSVQNLIQPLAARERVANAVDDLDATAKDIRTTIFELQNQRVGLSRHGLRTRIVEVFEHAVPALGFNPLLRMEGLLDTVVSPALEEHLVATLVEALSNIARHAQAHSAEVTVTATETELVLSVVDDGIGIPEGGRRSGLANLAERARSCGGELTTLARESGGTRLLWRAPLQQPA
ncbi:GAF domain-containing sensor histidine kinase [Streptacidiphilus sp. EB129]|uniref:GAF domain-containing sensor histidine kinase n=1 Tax=Streptacidiphilus sp. EB129 TaxID=3156262 RepID=UPI0035175F7E